MITAERKIFGTLFFSIFTSVTGVGIVVPLLPVYAHQLGAGGMAIGMIFGAFSLSRTACLPFFGRLSDRKGRKPFIVTGLLAYSIIALLFLTAATVTRLIAIRFAQGIASAMLMPVVLAYVGDISPQGREGATMGLFNLSLFIGLSVGPLVGGLISDGYGLSAAFLAMGVMAGAGFVLAWWLLPPTAAEAPDRTRRPPAAWSMLLSDRPLTGLFIMRLAYAACIGMVWSFMPVFAETEFDLSAAAIGVLVTLGVLVSGLLHPPMGRLADRLSRPALVIAGGLATCGAIGGFWWVGGFGGLVLVNVLLGVGGGLAMPALMALAVQRGQAADAMGSVMALITMAHSLGMLVGAMAAGAMMQWFELRWAFPLGAVLMLAAVAAFLLSIRGRG